MTRRQSNAVPKYCPLEKEEHTVNNAEALLPPSAELSFRNISVKIGL